MAFWIMPSKALFIFSMHSLSCTTISAHFYSLIRFVNLQALFCARPHKKLQLLWKKHRHPFREHLKKKQEEIEHVDNATATIELKRRCAVKNAVTAEERWNWFVFIFRGRGINSINACVCSFYTTQRLFVFHMANFSEIVSHLWIWPRLNFSTWTRAESSAQMKRVSSEKKKN